MTRGIKRTVPLFILCRREGCENLREVRCPSEQRRGGYCSQRCNALATQNIRKAWRRGVEHSAQARKRRLLARLDGLNPVDCFRLGYKAGKSSKSYVLRKRYVFIRRQAL